MGEPRRHVMGGGPHTETGKTVTAVEDPGLVRGFCRIECAHSDADIAQMMASVAGGIFLVTVAPKKGISRGELFFFVAPSQFDDIVRLMEDEEGWPPMTDAEFAAEMMRITRRNN